MSKTYTNMADVLKSAETENFKLTSFTIDPNDFRAMLQGISAGNYVRLEDKRLPPWEKIIMSDTPMERRTNSHFVNNAHGDILIAGLGIGLILLAIQDKSEVTSITVIEKEPEIIDLITSQLNFNKKVEIIEDDIYHYRPDTKFDCIYFDIWNYINEDVYKDMLFLKDGFRRYLKPKEISPNRYIKCWAETEARYNMELR